MTLTLPRLSKKVATASVPTSHGVVTLAQRSRLARRIAAAARGQGRGRWSPRRLQHALVQVPNLPALLRTEEPSSRATASTIEEIRLWLRAAAEAGLLTDEDHAALRGSTPEQAFDLLRGAVARYGAALCEPIARIVGEAGRRCPSAPVALHVGPLLALDESLAAGTDARPSPDFTLRLVGEECGLVEWRMCETTEDRAIRGALNALCKAVPVGTILPCDAGADIIGGMYVEFASDAVREARLVDGKWVIDPEAVSDFASELGFDDEADLLWRLQEFAEFQQLQERAAPLPPESEVVQAWLAANDTPSTRLVRSLMALADIGRSHTLKATLDQEWEGSVGPCVGLLVSPGGFEDWIGESGGSFYEEDQHIVQTFADPAQLLSALPASMVSVAMANATCTLLVDYLNHDR